MSVKETQRHSCVMQVYANLYFRESLTKVYPINTLRPRQNGRHFPDDILKWIFLNGNVWISIKISLKVVPEVPINNIPALVQIMAWRRSGDKPLSEPMMDSLLAHICVTQPQWVKHSHGFIVLFVAVTWPVPSHYLNQCWNILNWTLRNKLQWIKIDIFSFKKMHLKMLSGKCLPFCLGLNVFNQGKTQSKFEQFA